MSAHAGDERLGPYCLREQLGEGGMGVVYLASDAAERPVAIKVLRQGVAADRRPGGGWPTRWRPCAG